ncbi:MAG: TonB-dependent receptor [Prevotellaceae bacterium]|jgi:iron complex outermembrane receptor protein|nr:TonB-dependent receptor [Prevotellaceae bacterium]
MKQKSVFIFLSFSFSFFTFGAYSQDTIKTLDEIVITGTKSLVNKNQIPINISIVNKADIDNSGESSLLPLLSKHVPGLFVTERGVAGFGVSAGSAGSVSIRGIDGNKVLMLFDGQPQWAGIFGHNLPDTYLASDIERVEVVRGPASLLYGSNAMGGVINMITRNPEQGTDIGGRIMYGSYNTQKYLVRASRREGKISGIISFNRDKTDGHRDNSEFSLYNGFAKLKYEPNKHWTADAMALIADYLSSNPGTADAPMTDNDADVFRSTTSLSVNNRYDNTEGAVKFFYNFGSHKINDGWTNGVPRDYLFHSKDYNRGAMIYQMLRFKTGTQITAGIDYKRWGGKAWNRYNNNEISVMVDTGVEEFAAYALVQQSFFNRLTVNAGIRSENNESYGGEFIPQGGISFGVNDNTTLKASVSKGFRSPNLRELYLFMPANPELEPERNVNYDVSVLQNLLNGKVNLELTAFFTEGDNMIQTVPIDGRPLNINSGRFINKGIEFAGKYDVVQGFNLSANYSFLYMNSPLLAVPKHQLNFQIYGTVNKFGYNVGIKYIDGLYLDTETLLVESYLLLDAKVSYALCKNVSVFVKGENLGNTDYSINWGFPMPGIVVFGGIDLKLK